tara:strand:+ start:21194 stop:21436 length:243 start_codon:yes stop_codon:yes gene_type:complete
MARIVPLRAAGNFWRYRRKRMKRASPPAKSQLTDERKYRGKSKVDVLITDQYSILYGTDLVKVQISSSSLVICLALAREF